MTAFFQLWILFLVFKCKPKMLAFCVETSSASHNSSADNVKSIHFDPANTVIERIEVTLSSDSDGGDWPSKILNPGKSKKSSMIGMEVGTERFVGLVQLQISARLICSKHSLSRLKSQTSTAKTPIHPKNVKDVLTSDPIVAGENEASNASKFIELKVGIIFVQIYRNAWIL